METGAKRYSVRNAEPTRKQTGRLHHLERFILELIRLNSTKSGLKIKNRHTGTGVLIHTGETSVPLIKSFVPIRTPSWGRKRRNQKSPKILSALELGTWDLELFTLLSFLLAPLAAQRQHNQLNAYTFGYQ
jgi:hypothetical protein